MKLAEQITAFEQKRAALAARMEAIMKAAGDEGRTLDEAEREEYDGIDKDVEAVDEHLKRLRALEKAKAAAAKPVPKPGEVTPANGPEARGNILVLPKKLPPGIQMARVVKLRALAKLDGRDVVALAKEMYPDDDLVQKAAVAAGTSTHSTWAKPLVGDETAVFADFVEFLRPSTIVGKFGMNGIPALRRVPFRTPLIGQTSGGRGWWVGQGKGKPVTKFDFVRRTLDPLKVANIAVTTMELLRDSSPSAETIVRDQLAAALRETIDVTFIDPDVTAVGGVSPASITNLATPIMSVGNDAESIRQDVRALFAAFIAANLSPTSGVWIMSSLTALALSLLVNPLSTQREFPGINVNGGTFEGLPVITSEYIQPDSSGHYVVLVNAEDIYFADDGGIEIDMSREASLEMDDAPAGAADSPPVPGELVSLWQTNSVGFKAERTLNWMPRRDVAVAVLSAVNWGQPAPTSP